MEALSFEPFAKSNSVANLLTEVDFQRLLLSNQAALDNQKVLEQFLTPAPIAELMSGLFEDLSKPEISLLDVGAGTGILLAAVVQKICQIQTPPKKLSIVAYEIDCKLLPYLEYTLKLCRAACVSAEIDCEYEVRNKDFIEDTARILLPTLWNEYKQEFFTHAILNPPYSKISSTSKTCYLLKQIGVKTTNIYTGFMAAAALLLEPQGEIVSITPRSFCSGTYFRPFRDFFLNLMSLRQVHLFESRDKVFSDDAVLQETIIFHCLKQQQKKSDVVAITTSSGTNDDMLLCHRLPYSEVVRSDDDEKFIRILPDAYSQLISQLMGQFDCTLEDLGISVSTGRVVDFRSKEYLRWTPGKNTVPLIYPINFAGDSIVYPVLGRKPQALVIDPEVENLLVPDGNYVLCKRFSSKEEKRRVVTAIYEAGSLGTSRIGFENHLNYFHQGGRGLDLDLARGLSIFLNSSLLDNFFRLFNGHTQINVSDLRSLRYPTKEKLLLLGKKVGDKKLTYQEIDSLVEKELLTMSESNKINPLKAKTKIDEALDILKQLGFPKQQLNERSALTLLALTDTKPSALWEQANARLIGITPIMEFMADYYGKTYKPNTRETVRRQTVHQFLDAALVTINPDNPERPTNSPKTVYKIEESALELVRQYNTNEWYKALNAYLASVGTLKQKYAQERELLRIPIMIEGQEKTLSPGGQNILVKKIIDEFRPCFTPDGSFLYVGDTDKKFAHFMKDALAELGVNINSHGKMPDVIIYFRRKNWLILIEAVTSHGPINPKRKKELEKLFAGVTIPLVMVTAFLNRRAMVEYLPEIAWETDVWVAEDATHLIHFNGQHLLQAYRVEPL
ncbi:BsuBI/PstI family type II restriction endonuclease [Leptolyngbya ohadii]|uniref:BsuBI/PstI family type II restriction endonuclease n=1 Tax=Leptolyngbya ohadii TaxID=1962290 RepID=UPI0019D4A916|nr:BsuBI/PstI family type II restriction endonuclease [Leptolyngbya ohadii]